MYTNTQVDSLLTGKASSSDISTAIARKTDKSTTYIKTDNDSLLAGKASSSVISTAIAWKADKSTTYYKYNVDTALTVKQNTLTFIDPMNLGNPVAGYPLLVGTNIIPGLSVQLPLTLTRNAKNYLTIGVSTSIFNQPTLAVTRLKATSATQSGRYQKTNRTDETLLFKATKYIFL